MTDLAGASAIADAVRDGERSAREVIEEHIERHRSTTTLNAFISFDGETALRRAAELDRRRARNEELGPLAGVPISVKDIVAVEGFPLTVGSKAFAHNRATATATAVARLQDAGAIVLGKTNLPEFAFGTTCDSPLLGPTANPIASDRSPGGSSGGEAAAVAAGVSALGIGTDYGGSLRWPAACTGIVAIRPTAGTVPGEGQVPGSRGDMSGRTPSDARRMQTALQVIGPLARSVGDLELALRVLADRDIAEPDTGAVRIGWSSGADIGPVRTETVQAIARLGAALGATEVATELAEALSAYNAFRDLDPLLDHRMACVDREDLLSTATIAAIRSGTSDSGAIERARQRGHEAAAGALRVFDRVDVLILPVAGGPACDPDGTTDVDGRSVSGWELMSHCRAVTMLGAPAASVPMGRTLEGLPMSVQVVAAPGYDFLALAVARRIEQMATGDQVAA